MKPAPTERASDVEMPLPEAAGPTILIVDDSPVNLAVAVDCLQQRGFPVAIAEDGEEALERTRLVRPELILLDVMLPGMDGFEVCRRLKTGALTRDIPVIFMTALSDPEYVARGFEAGGVDYVSKPLRVDEMMARVGIHLRLSILQKRLGEQNAQLREAGEMLELQVTERTAELCRTNLRLQQEIAERQQVMLQLQEKDQRYRDIFENTLDGIAFLEVMPDLRFRIISINPAFEKLAQVTSEQVAGKYIEDIFPAEAAAKLAGRYRQCVQSGTALDYDSRHEWPVGFRIDQATAIPIRDENRRIHRIAVISRDVTQRRSLELLLRKREAEMRELVEHSPDTIARYDRDCRRIYANPKLVAALGGDTAQVLGTTPEEYPGGPTGRVYMDAMRQVLEHGEMRDFELRWEAGGKEMCSHIRMSPECDASGRVTHVLEVGRDITEIDQYRKKIHHQAFFDSLTGLPNRLSLSERLAAAACSGTEFGLMMLDLDHFKNVNDTLGHSIGDRLLCETAARLSACVRAGDTVARLGGDEFAILLHAVRSGDEIVEIAGKIQRRLAEPFVMEGRELFVTCSIGIARFPSDAAEADGLYKYADSAMYHAKKMGRNNFQFYARELTARSVERLEVEAALRKARKNGELALYYQPQFDLQQECLVGAEALLRWQRPGHGLVGPNAFIPLAEESGLIVDIGEWVLRSACEAAVRWNRHRQEIVKVAVNMSSRQFMRNNLVDTVVRTLLETECKAEWLELEITESLLLEDSEDVNATLGAFHGMGITISIDDFGTGYSALSYLHRFPVSRLKIDRSFVNGMTEQRDKRELVKAMLSIASALRIESVAEGVETSEQAQYLTARGCRVAQGYLFGKPMPDGEFESMLKEEAKA